MANPSIVYREDRCAVCGRTDSLELHHCIFGTANRKLADKDGLTVMLCPTHHRAQPFGVHGGNRKLDLELKQAAEMAWLNENENRTIDDFIHRYGKSWI